MKKVTKVFLFIGLYVFCSLSFPSPAYAATYYVDNSSGNDSFVGTTTSTAWKSLQKISSEFLAKRFIPGDQILLKRGQMWVVSSRSNALQIAGSSGSLDNPILISAYGSGSKPKVQIAAGSNLSFAVGRVSTLPASNYIAIDGLDIDANGYDGTVARVYGASNWTLNDISIHGLRSGASTNHALGIAQGSKWITVKNSVIYDNDGEAIKIGSSKVDGILTENVVISNVQIYDNTGEAIDLRDEATNIFVYGGLFTNNGTKQDPIAFGGRYGYFYRCRVENSTNGIDLARYISEGSPGYSGNYHTLDRCLFKNIGTTDKGAIQLSGRNHTVINSTIVNTAQPMYVIGDSRDSRVLNNIFSGYPSSAISGNVGLLKSVAWNGFPTGSSQGSNALTGIPSFSSTDTYQLATNSPYYHALPNGKSLGWSEPGWTEDNYKQEFISSISSKYSPDIVQFVSKSISASVNSFSTPTRLSVTAARSPSITPTIVRQPSQLKVSLVLRPSGTPLQGSTVSGKVAIEAVATGGNSSQTDFFLYKGGILVDSHTERIVPYYFKGDNVGNPYYWNTTGLSGNYVLTAEVTATSGTKYIASGAFLVNSAEVTPTPIGPVTTLGPVSTGANTICDDPAAYVWHSPGSHSCSYLRSAHPHEHGDAPPTWVQTSKHPARFHGAHNTSPVENSVKHASMKGFSATLDGMDIYIITHFSSVPMERFGNYHSYQYWMKPAGDNDLTHVSYAQGWTYTGEPTSTTARCLRRNPPLACENARPIILVTDRAAVSAGIGCEQWYNATADWSIDFGVTVCGSATYYVREKEQSGRAYLDSTGNIKLEGVFDRSTWETTGSMGLTRRMEIAWYGPNSNVAPNRGNPPKNQVFYATQFGEIVSGAFSSRCKGTTVGRDGKTYANVCLPQYISSAARAIEFPGNAIQKNFPGSGIVQLPN